MPRLRVAAAVAVLLLVSVRFPTGLTESGLAPLWLLLPVLVAGLSASPGQAAAVGWVSGLVVDLFSLAPLGLNAYLFAGAGYLVARVRTAIFADDARTQAVLGFGVTFVVCVCLLARLEIVHPSLAFWSHVPRAFSTAVLTGVALPFVVTLDRRAAGWFGSSRS